MQVQARERTAANSQNVMMILTYLSVGIKIDLTLTRHAFNSLIQKNNELMNFVT
jgi:hypothetical protein